jgi:hypothetical protein
MRRHSPCRTPASPARSCCRRPSTGSPDSADRLAAAAQANADVPFASGAAAGSQSHSFETRGDGATLCRDLVVILGHALREAFLALALGLLAWTSAPSVAVAHPHKPIKVSRGVGVSSPRLLQMNVTSETFHTAKAHPPIKVGRGVGASSHRLLQMNATSETFHTAKLYRPRVCPKSAPAGRCACGRRRNRRSRPRC